MTASPFGFGPLPQLDPDVMAALMQRLQAGQADMPAPGASPVSFLSESRDPNGGFFIPPGVRATAPSGDPSGLRPGDMPPAPAMPSQVASAPAVAPPSLVGSHAPAFGFGALPVAPVAPPRADPVPPQAVAEEDDEPAARQVPLPPPRPLSFGALPQTPPAATPQADMPAAGAVPASGQAPADAGSDLSAGLSNFKRNGGFDLLGNIGIGLMSTHGLGNGLAAGLKLDQDQQAKKAVSGLANAELDLKRQKLARETAGQNSTRAYLLSKGMAPDLADAAMTNPAILSSTLGQLNKDPSIVEIGGKKYSLKPGEKPSEANLLGDASADNSLRVLSTPEERAAAGIQPNDTRTARIDTNNKVTFDPAPPAPTVHILEDENGNKHIRQYDPKSGSWIDPAQPPGAPPAPTNPLALKGKTTGDQAKAAGFSDRMLNSERILAEKQKEGTDLTQRMYDNVPLVGNYLTSDAYQGYSQAKRDFVNAQLRRESGAAIGKDEFASADKQYFPQPGDSAETIAQKAKNRRIAVEAMTREAGTTYLPTHIYDDAGAIVPYAPGQRKSVPHEPAPNAPIATAVPRSKSDYDALPSGAKYLAPDGTMRQKP